MKKESKTFLYGVVVLTVANILTKVIGLVFKIPLTNMLDNEGMGYFNTAYQIYTWLYMLSTAGVPVALSVSGSVIFTVSNFQAGGARPRHRKQSARSPGLFSARKCQTSGRAKARWQRSA